MKKPTSLPLPSLQHFLAAAITLLLVALPRAEAAFSSTLDSATVDNLAFQYYILDSDAVDGNAATNFHGLDTDFQVTVQNTSLFDPNSQRFYRVCFQLMRANNGSPVPVTLSSGLSIGYTAQSSAFLSSGINSQTLTFNGIAIPQNPLDEKESYFVRGQLQSAPLVILPPFGPPPTPNWVNVAGEVENSPTAQVVEFNNTSSVDTAYNIRTVQVGLTWDKTYALATDSTDDGFQASLGVFAMRYDGFASPATSLTATVSVDFDLIEQSSGNSIPLENNGVFTQTSSASSHATTSGRPVPSYFGNNFFGYNFQEQIVPLTQLDSVNESYVLRATVRHINDGVGTVRSGPTCALAPQRLLHFNGELLFNTLATTVTEFNNIPTAGTSGANFINTTIQVTPNSGTIDNRPDVAFGNNGSLNVRLYDTGEMTLTSGSQVAYLDDGSGNPITCTSWEQLKYNSVTLNSTGARANGYRYELPQGLVFFPNTNLNKFMGETQLLSNATIPLDTQLCNLSALTINLGNNAAVADESHPLILGTNEVTLFSSGNVSFDIQGGKYTHEDSYTLLANLFAAGDLDNVAMIDRCSNDRYLLTVSNQSTVAEFHSGPDGTVRLETTIEVAPTSFQTHFPQKSEITFSGTSQVIYKQGEISTIDGSALDNVSSVKVPYHQGCADSCGINPSVVVTMATDSNKLGFSPGGGLHGVSSSVEGGSGHALQWGKRSLSQYAHRTDTFGEANFYMPGYQLYAVENALLGNALYGNAADHAASALLLGAFNRDYSAPDLHVPSEPDYRDGKGDLAGMNFEVTSGSFGGASRLASNTVDYSYNLLEDQGNGGSKYYIRQAGVSGRQVAVDGSYAGSINFHDFPTTISQFQLSFLESTNEAPGCDSWVDGNVAVSGYSNWDQEFTGLRFDCLGEPGDMTVDLTNSDDKSLSYWNSSFDLKSLTFLTYETPLGSCNFKAKLAAGALTRVSHVPQDLFGTLAFCPDGNLSTQQDAIDNPDFDGINSQLRLPSSISLDGPNKPYSLVATSKLRFSNPIAAGAPASGFVTFAATIDIPYFKDLQVQAITTASDSPAAPFALTPGWTESIGGSLRTFFDFAEFDPTHRGFPASGIAYDDYRNPAAAGSPVAEAFLIKAQQDMFGFIPLSYPLFWDDTTRRFASSSAREQDIFVAQMEHKVDWMDAKFTNISFGATYDGLPQLKLSNFLNGEIDKASEAISAQIGALPKQAIDKGLDELDKMLEDALCALINPLIDSAAGSAMDPGPIRDLYRAIEQFSTNASMVVGSSEAQYAAFRSELETTLNNPADALFTTIPGLQDLQSHLCLIADASSDAGSFVKQIEEALEDIIKGIDVMTSGIVQAQSYETNITAPDLTSIDAKGILFRNSTSGELEIVSNLIDILLVELVEPAVREILQPLLEAGASELNEQLNALLTDIDPALEQISNVLLTVREFLVDVHTQVTNTGTMVAKFETMVTDAKNGNLLNELLRPVTTRAWNYFLQIEETLQVEAIFAAGNSFTDGMESFFDNFTEEEFVQLLKDELKDAILQSDLIKQTQYLLRQTLYDIADKITSSLQSVLAQITNVMKEVVSSTIGALEEQINPLLGTISEYMGSGEITGYAEFNGDSLRKLRLDAKMEFTIPEEMALHVYLEVLAYTSEDNFVQSGCIEPGEKMVEVRIGAKDVSVEWISECKINLEVKLSLKDYDGEGGNPPLPIGVGGTFELSDGEIDFQTFKILEFGATIAIGLEECYLGARARAIFSNYEVAAGIFFGRTCTIEPLLFVDPDIGDVVEPGTTFTGAYVYGEVWLPVSEIVLGVPASCLFRIDAGVGAGAFYFLEGPTYGGKVLLGVSGEALCVVSIRGEIRIILASQAGRLRGAGSGKFSAKIGWCPFCIKFNKSVRLLFDDGDWSMQ